MENIHPFNGLICQLVFPYLERKELLYASMVCKLWNENALDGLLWKTIKIKDCRVIQWNKLVAFMNKRGTVCLDTRDTVLPTSFSEITHFWNDFSNAIVNAENINMMYLYKCTPCAAHSVINKLFKLKLLDICITLRGNVFINLWNIYRLTNLTELRIHGFCNVVYLPPPTFSSLTHLKTLALYSMSKFNDIIWHSLSSINTTSLTHLELGYFNMDGQLDVFLNKLSNLTFLKLKSSNTSKTYNDVEIKFFNSIKNLKNLHTLELVNIEHNIIIASELEKCPSLKKLRVIPTMSINAAEANHVLIKFLRNFKNKLTHLEVKFQSVVNMREVQEFIGSHHFERLINKYLKTPIQTKTMQILNGNETNLNDDESITILDVSQVKLLLNNMMPNTNIIPIII